MNRVLQAEQLQAIAGFAQVNLLETLATARRRGLPWWSPLACAALVTSVALGSGLQLNPLVAELKTRALKREAQVQEQTHLIELAARQNKGGSAKDQAQALQAALTQQERLLELLGGDSRGGGLGGDVGSGSGAGLSSRVGGDSAPTAQHFSALLEGLSRTRVDGLWLTQVRLDRRTQEVRLEGQARHAQLVSGYIDELSRNPRFKGLVLAAVEVSRPAARFGAGAADEPTHARFKLASAQATPQAPAQTTTPAKTGATP